MTDITITHEMLESHVKKIRETIDSINPGKISILVGENATGKSIIRKQLIFYIAEKLRIKENSSEFRHLVKSISMESRTASNPEWGALSNVMHDLPWIATSVSTYHNVRNLFNILEAEDAGKYFYIMDEPEIGMNLESQLGLANYLKEKAPSILDKTYGLLIITHSDILVETLKDIADFHYIGITKEYKSVEEYLTREICPTDFDFLDEWAGKLFEYIRDRNSNKKD